MRQVLSIRQQFQMRHCATSSRSPRYSQALDAPSPEAHHRGHLAPMPIPIDETGVGERHGRIDLDGARMGREKPHRNRQDRLSRRSPRPRLCRNGTSPAGER